MIYGSLPDDLGLIDIDPKEMMFWMYCPVKVPYGELCLPDNLKLFQPIIDGVMANDDVHAKYMYLTAKTLWVEGSYIGNRAGWHSDGFGTDDVNYIWYTDCPTEFIGGEFHLSTDCDQSMIEMEKIAETSKIITYGNKHLLRLTPEVIHRSPIIFPSGIRSFVKVSLSDNVYDLEGNSINHGLGVKFNLHPRKVERNHPASTSVDHT